MLTPLQHCCDTSVTQVGCEMSIDEISKATSITTANIIETLKFHGVLVWYVDNTITVTL
jgi:hypothetical protein